eukprot:c32825_g1_i1.p1 GENE.c32825_g1_i1~~c32825_g1_i1.p1  ORF type:complete len:345 (+),score=90.09 c32825_g1_i1:48-1037(+)
MEPITETQQSHVMASSTEERLERHQSIKKPADEILSPTASRQMKQAQVSKRISSQTSDAHQLHMQIDKLTTSSVVELCQWMQAELGDRFNSFSQAFLDHGIDGRCFALLHENHLKDMSPSSTIGDRLYVLAARDKMIRAARIARRSHVIMQGSAKVIPPNENAEYVLTNGSLKLIFTRVEKIAALDSHGQPIVQNSSQEQVVREKTRTSTLCDHIDLSTIEDVDIESETQLEEIFETVKRKVVHKSCFSERVEWVTEKRSTGQAKEVGVANLFVTLSSGTSLRDANSDAGVGTRSLTLTLKDFQEGERLHQAMINQIEEIRQVQITHVE